MDENPFEFDLVLPSRTADLACTRKGMTVAQVAEALGTAESTIRNKVAELFPELVQNGKTTYLLVEHVQKVKESLVPRNLTLKSKVDSAVTALDIEEMTIKVLSYHKAEAERLRAELAIAAPKCAGFDALMRSDQTMSITDAAKHFGLHPKTQVFPYLREHGYLTKTDMPSQDSIDAGYLAVRETNCLDGTVRKQAVVLACQLDAWRTRVIPQINRWIREDIGE